MADPQRPAYLRWQQAIELDPRTTGVDRAKALNMLEDFENSQVGQEKLAEALAIQSQTPVDKLRELTEELKYQLLPDKEYFTILSRQTEAPKIFLSIIADHEASFSLLTYTLMDSGGAFALTEANAIVLNFSMIEQTLVPKMNHEGEKELVAEPHAADFAHELQHVIDGQRRLWVTGEKELTRACLEERAVQTGNRLLQEKDLPLRVEYFSPELKIRETLRYDPYETSIMELRQSFALNEGCKGFSKEQLDGEIKKMLLNLGLEPDKVKSWVADAVTAGTPITIPALPTAATAARSADVPHPTRP